MSVRLSGRHLWLPSLLICPVPGMFTSRFGSSISWGGARAPDGRVSSHQVGGSSSTSRWGLSRDRGVSSESLHRGFFFIPPGGPWEGKLQVCGPISTTPNTIQFTCYPALARISLALMMMSGADGFRDGSASFRGPRTSRGTRFARGRDETLPSGHEHDPPSFDGTGSSR